jgi:SAM-dependent methyltransferase
MAETDIRYGGGDNLDVMDGAENYNAALADLVAAEFAPGSEFLDFGAGNGTFARLMRGRGFTVACLEVDPAFREQLGREGFRVFGSLAEVPEASLDGIYTLNVLEHIEHDVEVLRLLHRRLKPGAGIVIYVPAFQVLYSAMDRAIGHYRRYTRQGLVARMRSAGFAVRSSRYHDCLGYAAALVYRFVGDRRGRLKQGQVQLYDRWVFPPSRALDRVCGRLFGKNVSAVGLRPRED